MTNKIKKLSEKSSKLSVRRSDIISELHSVEQEHCEVEDKLHRAKQDPRSELIGRDAKGNSLRAGNSVTTLTQGKYYE